MLLFLLRMRASVSKLPRNAADGIGHYSASCCVLLFAGK
jgi:hypothetical protein